ncbi:hypothetical protein [Actinomadura oligospora]|uniref:hypothetical protein n=1 Tax=Actinomadura oligospora TaxID=111804 RepID=UPI00047A0F10|nr:hypothetical protein [Actinomadura oligospora]
MNAIEIHDKLQARAAKGAAFLNEQKPLWADSIDLSCFNMDSRLDCVLGQLYEDFNTALNRFGWSDNDAIEYGFLLEPYGDRPLYETYDELTDVWRELIKARRSSVAVSYSVAKLRALKGAALLTSIREDEWWNLIKLDRLSMKSGVLCILGQLYGDYLYGTAALNDLTDDEAEQLGFIVEDDIDLSLEQINATYALLDQAWHEVIKLHREFTAA